MKNTFASSFKDRKDLGEKLINSRVNFVQAGEGAPVIMAHGLAASLHDWDVLLPELVSHGYAGYALDLLGHGASDKPGQLEFYTSDSVFAHMQGWINRLELAKPVILIGHSLGGYLALQYTLAHPDRVQALILANPFYTQKQLPPMLRFFLRRPLLNTNLIEHTPYWLFRLLIDVTSLQFGNTKEKFHRIPENVRIQTALDYKRAAPGIYNIPRTLHDLIPELPRITQPTIVIWGARDQTINPKTFPLLVEKLPNAHGEVMPICGHVPHQCHASEFNQKVFGFLETLKV
jgi:pimeloyl-ACP methyl ester carboxylesterase